MRIAILTLLLVMAAGLRAGEAAVAVPVPAHFDWWQAGGKLAVGQPVPDVPLFDLAGNEVRLGAFAGKRYLLVVVGSW